MVPNRILSEGEKVLDHIAHWVPDLDAASEPLESLGFILTPWSEQHASPRPDTVVSPVGAANRCIMLRSGYLEILAPLSLTPIGRELQAGIDRYVGVHLLAFGSPDTKAEQVRLEALGFPQRPVVALRREVETEGGETATLHFTVGRAELGSMAEGRVQFLTHHTPEHLWQTRYLGHPNTAEYLAEVWIVVGDLDEAAARYSAYLDLPAGRVDPGVATIRLSRGRVSLFTPEAFRKRLPTAEIPTLPFIAGYGLTGERPRAGARAGRRDARSGGPRSAPVLLGRRPRALCRSAPGQQHGRHAALLAIRAPGLQGLTGPPLLRTGGRREAPRAAPGRQAPETHPTGSPTSIARSAGAGRPAVGTGSGRNRQVSWIRPPRTGPPPGIVPDPGTTICDACSRWSSRSSSTIRCTAFSASGPNISTASSRLLASSSN